MDLLDVLALPETDAAPVTKTKAGRVGSKWYQRHEPGWAPEADDMTLAPRPLADCNCHQVPSVVYAPVMAIEDNMIGAKLYYPGFGVLWQYRGMFYGYDDVQYYEVEALGRVDGCGIAVGSVWSAEAGKFRRVA
jgi:hypothetical protein